MKSEKYFYIEIIFYTKISTFVKKFTFRNVSNFYFLFLLI